MTKYLSIAALVTLALVAGCNMEPLRAIPVGLLWPVGVFFLLGYVLQ